MIPFTDLTDSSIKHAAARKMTKQLSHKDFFFCPDRPLLFEVEYLPRPYAGESEIVTPV